MVEYSKTEARKKLLLIGIDETTVVELLSIIVVLIAQFVRIAGVNPKGVLTKILGGGVPLAFTNLTLF